MDPPDRLHIVTGGRPSSIFVHRSESAGNIRRPLRVLPQEGIQRLALLHLQFTA